MFHRRHLRCGSFGQTKRIPAADQAGSNHRGVHADVGSVLLGGGTQDLGVGRQIGLWQRGHHAAGIVQPVHQIRAEPASFESAVGMGALQGGQRYSASLEQLGWADSR